MAADVLFLDVETPNGHNDRISSIGLIRCDCNGAVLAEDSYLVDPEEPFSEINMRLTGISHADVAGAPTFPEIWSRSLKSLFDGAALVAHNASFDLAVLWKLFDAYELDRPEWNYACTKELAKQWHPEYPDYKLPTVCRCLDLEMGNHHRALDDADACRRIFHSLVMEDEGRVPTFAPYSLGASCKRRSNEGASRASAQRVKSEKTADYCDFLSLCEMIVANGRVDALEAMSVLQYVEEHDKLQGDPLLDKVCSLLTAALVDGDIDERESNQLVGLLQGVINPCSDGVAHRQVQIEGKKFCLSGTFYHGSKECIKQFILQNGGQVLSGVSKKCDYVVVGDEGSDAWTTKNYGSKVKKALELQSKGDDIQIVSEDALGL